MKKMMSNTLLACALTGAFAMASNGAFAQTTTSPFQDFTVNEAFANPNATKILTADKITGNYTEVITLSGNTFDVSLLWNAGEFATENGSRTIASGLSPTGGSASQYGLYALYTGMGTVSTSTDGKTTFNFTPGGSLKVYLDPNSDTTFNKPDNGSALWTTGSATDDILIATGAPTSGQGTLDPSLFTCGSGGGMGINCGSFGTTTSFNLNSDGSKYFIAPTPFYNISFQSGQLNYFTASGTTTTNGSLDVAFTNAVPEPGSIALIGLGLMGFAVARRKSAKS